MERALSTHIFLDKRLHPGLLDALAAAGATAIEVFCAGQHFDYTSRTEVAELKAYFSGSPVRLHSLHGPMYAGSEMGRAGAQLLNIVHRERSRRIDAMDELKRSLEVAETVSFKHFILHLDERDEPWDEQIVEFAITAIEHLQAFSRPLGVSIALENLPNLITHPEQLMYLLRVSHLDNVGLCLDTGHALLVATRRALSNSHAYDHNGMTLVARDAVVSQFLSDVQVMLPRVVTTHVHDNAGTYDQHMLPGDPAAEGTGVPWKELMPLLTAAPTQLVCNLELRTAEAAPLETLSERIAPAWELLGV